MPVRLVVAEDSLLVREGLATLLRAQAESLRPDLVLMDINLPGINGIEATRQITTANPGTVVILMSTYRAEDLPADAMDSGAAAYVHKEDFGPAIVRQIWDEHHTTS